MKLTRKVIQIAIGSRHDEENEHPVTGDRIYALCDDSTIWFNDMSMGKNEWAWETMFTVPQGPRDDIGDAFGRVFVKIPDETPFSPWIFCG
jgi:hypothetical protein